jgi:farnesyl-diphosphate farnesyltransferase
MSDVDDLLQKTSRTFAVTIPMLPAPTRQEVGIAYLLFRIIDTFEDAIHWQPRQRIEMIDELLRLLDAPDPDRARRLADKCLGDPPLEHPGYLELLREIPFVLREMTELPERSRNLLRSHVKRSGAGMGAIVSRTDSNGQLTLASVDELRDYCYIVAGIVGEMLTELYLLDRPALAPIGDYLRERARLFGEALQLVNILKDSQADAREGRVYLPPSVDRSEVVALARADLRAASEYTLALQGQGAERGLVTFNALLVRLALGTLSAMREQRPGGKLSRMEVFAIVSAVLRDVDDGRPVFPVAGAGVDAPAIA